MANLYAGHCPTRRFTRAEILEMPEFDFRSGMLMPDGLCRGTDDAGRLIVGVMPAYDLETLSGWRMAHCVRPIVVTNRRDQARLAMERMLGDWFRAALPFQEIDMVAVRI